MRNINEVFKFGIVGMANTAVDFIVFFTLWSWGVPYLAAQAVSYSAGTANSFFWNRSWTFKAAGQTGAGEVIRFIAINLAALGFSALLLSVLSGQPLLISKLIATLGAMALTFFGSRFWVFKQQRRRSI
ncbi:GtrA family protein [Domibacillus indicus]|uniref:GtrA family protein n=1 Tax=Domibacillus indicus TaxID=1437523 RepID=UPI000617CBE1|nr:GtrA family protein [Domibacillus indicus]